MRRTVIFLGILFIVGLSFFYLSNTDPKAIAQQILQQSDIQINGSRSWDIRVHNENVYQRVVKQGSLGLGESYMDGWWDSPQLDQFFYKLLSADLDKKVGFSWPLLVNFIKSKLLNLQSKNRAFEVGQQHYDLSNELFAKMLDPLMVYSCGYWRYANSLDQAQEHKLDLVAQKLALKPGMKILDIGCGWGGFAQYAAKKYGVEVVGITVSKEQAQYAKNCCKGHPVNIILQDYRDLISDKSQLHGQRFDRIVSVGMFEHVGYKNYREFIQIAHALLSDDGLFLLHTIGTNESQVTGDPWINKYIFPNGMLPSICQIAQVSEGLFIIEDWHNFGTDYDKTLLAWYENFVHNWPSLQQKYDQRFFRMWKYYLLSCAAQFRSRRVQLWQIVLSKGISEYKSIR